MDGSRACAAIQSGCIQQVFDCLWLHGMTALSPSAAAAVHVAVPVPYRSGLNSEDVVSMQITLDSVDLAGTNLTVVAPFVDCGA